MGRCNHKKQLKQNVDIYSDENDNIYCALCGKLIYGSDFDDDEFEEGDIEALIKDYKKRKKKLKKVSA